MQSFFFIIHAYILGIGLKFKTHRCEVGKHVSRLYLNNILLYYVPLLKHALYDFYKVYLLKEERCDRFFFIS
jgi:hypothetical protein